MKLILGILMFFLLSAFLIISNNHLSIGDPVQRGEFTKQYSDWLDRIFDNGRSIVGYVAKSEWLPDNNSSKE